MKPTHTRHKVVVFGMTLAILAYIDRVCIAQAAPLISRDLGLSKVQMGTVLSAFLLSYGLFEIPGGWYGDWVGARKGLLRIVLGWSVFTALTGWAWSFVSMVAIRFCFGIGEAGCFPIIAKSFTTWLPRAERTRAQGFLWTAARWGGAFTPLLVVWVLRYVNWRLSFLIFGSLGLVWATVFYRWYRDNPRDHQGVNAAELEVLRDVETHSSEHSNVPWGKLLASRSVQLLAMQYYFLSFGWYFFLTWLPTYLQEHHHLTSAESAKYAVFPLLFNGIGSLFCGMITARVTGWTGSIARTRKMMACTGPGDAARLGVLHGCGREVRGVGIGRDEPDGQSGGREFDHDRRLPALANRKQLAVVHHDSGRRLFSGPLLLAVHSSRPPVR
jgi:ACS family glucarate transporter-like MFS transporter